MLAGSLRCSVATRSARSGRARRPAKARDSAERANGVVPGSSQLASAWRPMRPTWRRRARSGVGTRTALVP